MPANLPWDQADLAIQHPRAKWAQWGVTYPGGRALPADTVPASLVLPMGRYGPAFLAYDNFQAYLGWNASLVYSMTAAYLATRIAGAKPLRRGAPNIPVLSAAQVMELQQLLVRHGFLTAKPDGKLGLTTRASVRLAQMKLGLPADSYPTPELIERLRRPCVLVHEPRLLGVPERRDPDDHLRPLEQPAQSHRVRPSGQALGVVDDLRGDEVRARVELRFQPGRIVRFCERHVGDTDQVARRVGELGVREGRSIVTHPSREADHLAHRQIGHHGRVRMISHVDGVAREAEHVPRAEGPCAEQIRREPQAVPIANRELHGRLDPRVRDETHPREGRHVGARDRVVGQVDGIDVPDESARVLRHGVARSSLGRNDLARDGEAPASEQRRQTSGRTGHGRP